MTLTDKAYASGLFDGEGCVSFYRSPHLYVATSISSTDWFVLSWVRERWGGSISKAKAGKNRPIYHWRLFGKNAAAFLTDIRPYLHIKAAQVDLVVPLLNAPPARRGYYHEQGRESVRMALGVLHSHVWSPPE